MTITMPWIKELPTIEQVAEHAARWPVPEPPHSGCYWPGGCGAWLLRDDRMGVASIAYLRVATGVLATDVECWDMERAWCPWSGPNFLTWPFLAWLPVTPDGIPVAFLPDVDPRGEPIEHVPPGDALAAVEQLRTVALDFAEELGHVPAPSVESSAALAGLTAVIRERDHYVADRAQLQATGTALLLRARAAELEAFTAES